MNKFKCLNVYFSIAIFFLFSVASFAQSEKELLAQLVAEDQEAIDALVLYPEETRIAILEATKYPEALIKLESIQTQISSRFRLLVEAYPQTTQEMIWDLTRYPNLIHQLVIGNDDNISKVLKEYPTIIHARARDAILNYRPQLAKIDELNQSADAAFSTLIAAYPPTTQKALQELMTLPEVLTILTENIRLTVLVGDLYAKQPAWVLHQADSLSMVVARQNAEEINDWKESINNNPEAAAELKAATESFSEEYGYDDEYYNSNSSSSSNYDDIYYDDERDYQPRTRAYLDYHYPYWFGYPHWYSSPRWRIYPNWYDWGFYYGPGSTIVVIGLPSFYFTNWYFYSPYHHYYWGHLSAHFVHHYHGHRGGYYRSSITSSVNGWQRRNEEVITDTWLKDDRKLSSRFETFGKFETEREKYNQKNAEKPLSQKEYVERHTKKYPELAKSAEISKAERESTRKITPESRPSTTVPRTEIPKRNEPQVNPKVPQPDRTPPVRKTPTKENKGNDYHKDKWEQTSPPKVRIPITPAPKTRTKPSVKPKTPQRTTPTSKGTTKKKGN